MSGYHKLPPDDARIVPKYATSPFQQYIDRASRGLQELIVAAPFDQASRLEILKFLHEASVDTEEFFRSAPN